MIMKKTNLFIAYLFLMIATSMNAQIIYTDINPDGMPSGDGLDFNGDGTNEFTLEGPFYITYSVSGTNIWANGLPPGQGSDWDVPKPLVENTVIDENGNFIGCGDCIMNGVTTNPFPLNEDRYLGVKISIDGEINYGWVRVMWNGTTFIYRDFAYESTPNTAINAGATSTTGISNSIVSLFDIYPNPAQNNITIENNSQQKISEISFVNLLGKEIKKVSLPSDANPTIDISKLERGIYLIYFFAKDKIIESKKIIVY